MAENRSKKVGSLLWNKTMLTEILNCDLRTLTLFFKKKPLEGFTLAKGQQYYTDSEAYLIVKHVRQTYTHEEIMDLIYPFGKK